MSEQLNTALPTDRATHEPSPSGLGHSVSVPSAEELAARISDPEFQRWQAVQLLATRIGATLRYWRIRRGYTPVELAAKVGIPLRTLLRFERGECINDGLRMMGSLAWGLDLEIEFKVVPRLAQAIEARSGETERLDPKDESAVRQDAPEGQP